MAVFDVVTVSLGLLGIIIVTVNCTISVVIFKTKKFRNNNVYMIIGNIAVADMLVGISTIGDSVLAFGGWTSMYSCAIAYSFIALSFTSSVCLLSTLATNQCYAIALPINHRKNFNVKRMSLAIGVIWVCCGAVNLTAVLFNVTSKQEHIFPNEGCKITLSFNKDYVMYFCTFLIISFLYIVLTYTKIIQMVKHQARIMAGSIGMNTERKRRKREQTLRLTRKLTGVILLFLICWMPFTITALVWGSCSKVYTKRQIDIPSCVSEKTFTISASFALIHSCLNFVFYLCTFREFRKALIVRNCCHSNQSGTISFENGHGPGNTEQIYI